MQVFGLPCALRKNASAAQAAVAASSAAILFCAPPLLFGPLLMQVVHAIGLLFDVDSGLTFLNTFTSYSQSTPDASESTYDRITRETAFNVIDAVQGDLTKLPPPLGRTTPLAFVSCAEAGWPDVQFGDRVEAAAPEWLVRYLAAKRAVEAKLMSSSTPLCHKTGPTKTGRTKTGRTKAQPE